MILGITNCTTRKSRIHKMYKAESDFMAIESTALNRLCNLDLGEKEEDEVIADLSRGLSIRESKEVRECAEILCNKYQYEIASKAIDEVNYPCSPLFASELIKEETESSIDKLKDYFTISKIYPLDRRKISGYYLLGVNLTCDAITYNNAKYALETKILVKKNPFSFKLINTNFEIL